MIRKLATCLATGVAAFGLAACVSVLPEPKVPQGLYRFAAVETVYDLEASIVVREPEASRLVAGRAIAAEDSSGALRLVPNVEWTDSSTRLMQMAMLDALEGQGAGRAVSPETGAPAEYELSWQVTDFTLSGTTGRCRVRATLLEGASRDVLDQTIVSTTQQADGDSNADRAKALAGAGRACVDEVAGFVSQYINAHAAEPES